MAKDKDKATTKLQSCKDTRKPKNKNVGIKAVVARQTEQRS